jgi:hypothetical protein
MRHIVYAAAAVQVIAACVHYASGNPMHPAHLVGAVGFSIMLIGFARDL